MTKTPELQKLLNDWLAFAKENLLYAKGGLETDFSPYHTICFLCMKAPDKSKIIERVTGNSRPTFMLSCYVSITYLILIYYDHPPASL